VIPNTNPQKRETILKQLAGIEVWEAEKVVVEWSIRLSDDQVIKGRADTGRVKLAVISGSLAIYITKCSLETQTPPVELGEELCKYCDITDADKGMLLQQILMTSDLDAIRQMVSRRGLPVESLDSDLAIESEYYHTNFCCRLESTGCFVEVVSPIARYILIN
jgi:hypothetical protein